MFFFEDLEVPKKTKKNLEQHGFFTIVPHLTTYRCPNPQKKVKDKQKKTTGAQTQQKVKNKQKKTPTTGFSSKKTSSQLFLYAGRQVSTLIRMFFESSLPICLHQVFQGHVFIHTCSEKGKLGQRSVFLLFLLLVLLLLLLLLLLVVVVVVVVVACLFLGRLVFVACCCCYFALIPDAFNLLWPFVCARFACRFLGSRSIPLFNVCRYLMTCSLYSHLE